MQKVNNTPLTSKYLFMVKTLMKDRGGREDPSHTWAQGATPFLPNQDWPPTVAQPKRKVSNCMSFQGWKSDPISSLRDSFRLLPLSLSSVTSYII